MIRKGIFILLILIGIGYFTDAMMNMFVRIDRLHFEVFALDIGRVPYVIYELFISACLMHIGYRKFIEKSAS